MKCEIRRVLSHNFLAVGMTVLVAAAPASAQSDEKQGETTSTPAAVGTSGQVSTSPPITPAPPPQLAKPYWSNNGGYEVDTHDTGYAFFGPQYTKPFRPKMAFVAGANINYLYYQFDTGNGYTNVRAPGVSTKAGVKFGGNNYVTLKAGPSFRRYRTEVKDPLGNRIRSSSDTRVGLSVGADLWLDPTSHSNIYGIVDYGGLSDYTWSRLAYREHITNRSWRGKFAHFLGAEVIGQGNDDIRSMQFGPFLEVVHVPSTVSIMFRGGWKRSTFDVGPTRTGPWFAIGLWYRFQ